MPSFGKYVEKRTLKSHTAFGHVNRCNHNRAKFDARELG